ncbi:hypothetical protein [Bacillus sp. PK3_68]|uniref:hypothetical protein n=1 Tax=Bacillus sp. PK3_68 TaxID=2027408 RepID=UPI00160230C3|nr:hypothetical protein [Bacillus sp. PK3_68]
MRGKLIYMAVGLLSGLIWGLPVLGSIRFLLSATAFFFIFKFDRGGRVAFLVVLFLAF